MRPERIKILGKVYAVSYKTPGKAPLLDDDSGDIDYQKLEITIAEGLGQDEEQSTLLHEVLHAISHEMHAGLKEQHIERMENGLF